VAEGLAGHHEVVEVPTLAAVPVQEVTDVQRPEIWPAGQMSDLFPGETLTHVYAEPFRGAPFRDG